MHPRLFYWLAPSDKIAKRELRAFVFELIPSSKIKALKQEYHET
jgi:hypothetical protein